MNTIRFRTRLLAAAVLALAICSLPASAQSQLDLRQENQELKDQIANLTRQLEEARNEIQRLTDQVALLTVRIADTSAGAGASAPTQLEPEPVTIDESTPDASPRALLAAAMDEYHRATVDLEPGETGSEARSTFMRGIDEWVSAANRSFRAKVQWHVRIIGPAVPIGRGFVLRLQAEDPITGTILGDPFDATLSRSLVTRLRRREQRGDLDGVLVLDGLLVPRLQVNEDRTEEGPFDNPRFVGQFVEFGFTVQAASIAPPKPEKPAKTEDPPDDADGG